MVVDLGLPDMSGFDLLEKLKKDLGLHDLPVIVYTARDLSSPEETRLRKLAESIVIKDARSLERLLAETSLFLHRPSAQDVAQEAPDAGGPEQDWIRCWRVEKFLSLMTMYGTFSV